MKKRLKCEAKSLVKVICVFDVGMFIGGKEALIEGKSCGWNELKWWDGRRRSLLCGGEGFGSLC